MKFTVLTLNKTTLLGFFKTSVRPLPLLAALGGPLGMGGGIIGSVEYKANHFLSNNSGLKLCGCV